MLCSVLTYGDKCAKEKRQGCCPGGSVLYDSRGRHSHCHSQCDLGSLCAFWMYILVGKTGNK